MKITCLEKSTTKEVGVTDYIMGSKSMMLLVPSQKNFKLIFDSSYLLILL